MPTLTRRTNPVCARLATPRAYRLEWLARDGTVDLEAGSLWGAITRSRRVEHVPMRKATED